MRPHEVTATKTGVLLPLSRYALSTQRIELNMINGTLLAFCLCCVLYGFLLGKSEYIWQYMLLMALSGAVIVFGVFLTIQDSGNKKGAAHKDDPLPSEVLRD